MILCECLYKWGIFIEIYVNCYWVGFVYFLNRGNEKKNMVDNVLFYKEIIIYCDKVFWNILLLIKFFKLVVVYYIIVCRMIKKDVVFILIF